jgi:hypothetical protein
MQWPGGPQADGSPHLYDLTGSTPTPADGSFRLSYILGLGTDPSTTELRVGVLRLDAPSGFVPLPAPRPLSEPADSVTVTVVLSVPPAP